MLSEIRGQILNDATHVRELDQLESQRYKVEWWLLVLPRGDGDLVFNGDRVSLLQNEKSPRDGWWQWQRLHNHVIVPNATDLICTLKNG